MTRVVKTYVALTNVLNYWVNGHGVVVGEKPKRFATSSLKYGADMGITSFSPFETARHEAAHAANAVDANLWRWFCEFFEEGRLRWCKAAAGWFVSVDHKHLSTEDNFYDAIRVAKDRFDTGVRRVATRKIADGL